jgi:predicted RecA/RadA family phage recombinase
MKNYRQRGEVLTVAAPAGGVASGDVVAINKLIGIAVEDAAAGAPVEVEVEGVFSVTVRAADDIAVGATLYWNAGSGEFTTTASGNLKAGYATAPAGAGVTDGEIRFTPGAA